MASQEIIDRFQDLCASSTYLDVCQFCRINEIDKDEKIEGFMIALFNGRLQTAELLHETVKHSDYYDPSKFFATCCMFNQIESCKWLWNNCNCIDLHYGNCSGFLVAIKDNNIELVELFSKLSDDFEIEIGRYNDIRYIKHYNVSTVVERIVGDCENGDILSALSRIGITKIASSNKHNPCIACITCITCKKLEKQQIYFPCKHSRCLQCLLTHFNTNPTAAIICCDCQLPYEWSQCVYVGN